MKQVSNKQLFITGALIIFVMFLYLERPNLYPFILAALFGYLFNPVINLFTKYLRVNKIITIVLIYLALIAVMTTLLAIIGSRLLYEARQINQAGGIDQTAQQAIDSLPEWQIAGQGIGLKSIATQVITSGEKTASLYVSRTSPLLSGSAFSGILHGLVGVLVFLVAGFYFLRDWSKMGQYFDKIIPESNKDEIKKISTKVHHILGNYLRGQIILIIIMSSATFIVLEILGVKYSLTLAIASGFLEIIPYVGPVIAAVLAGSVAFFNGQNRFDLDPSVLTIIVLLAYLILRHAEDYFVIPTLYQKLTRLHPVVVIFSILAGGHLFGALGLVLAVPVAASLKVIIEYLVDPNSIDL